MSALLQLEHVSTKLPREDANLYRERVADLLQRRNTNFPGAQPVSFSRRHLGELQRADYYLCEKTDGIRCLLFLTFMIIEGERREACFLIDRKNDYYYVDNPHLHFPLPDAPPETFHTGTLLDGELVLDTFPDRTTARRYLVFDCLALDDKPLIDRTLDKRIGYFVKNVFEPYKNLFRMFPSEKAEQPFEVLVKKMEKAYGIEMMFRDVLPQLAHGNDGLVFTCREAMYTIGTDPKIIKWKPPDENTIDFRLQIGRFPPLTGVFANGDSNDDDVDYDATPAMELLVNHGNGKYNRFASLHVTEDEWESMKRMGQMLDHRVIECYKDEHGRWRFKREKDGSPRFRDDKPDANHISTVESVLESIEDAVGEQDLLNVAGRMRAGWKEREHEAQRRMQQVQQAQQVGKQQ